MKTIKVLIVDDSAVMRQILTSVLSSDPLIEIVGTASNGKIALSRIPVLKPDLVTLDIEMPELDGLTTLDEIRKLYPRLPVIMCSTLTERGASSTIEALSRGANDYIAKPSNAVALAAGGREKAFEQMIPKIKALIGFQSSFEPSVAVRSAPRLPPVVKKRTHTPQRIDIVAIGVSTGGPEALSRMIPRLPANLPVPVLIVQHMPPMFTQHLAQRLQSKSPLRISEAITGQELTAGQIWIAPGDFHLDVVRDRGIVRTNLHQGPPENSCRPAVDVLFRSVAMTYGPNALALILTGMGTDGLLGCQAIRRQDGHIIVQDQATSVVWGMPGAVSRAGLADKVLGIGQIADEITKLASLGRNHLPVINQGLGNSQPMNVSGSLV